MTHTITDTQKMYHQYRLCALSVLTFLLLAFAMIFFNHILTLLFCGFAVACHIFLLRPYQRKYERAVTSCAISHTLCRILNATPAVEKKDGKINVQTILNSNLMPCRIEKNSPLLRWQVEGHHKNLSVCLCDATIAQDFQLTANGKNRIHFNSGVWTHIELPKNTGKQFLILDETSVPTPIRMNYFAENGKYETASLEDEILAQKAVLYRPLGQPDQKPSAQFLQELKHLVNYTPGYVALSVNGCNMDIFIRGRFLSRPISLASKPTDALLEFDPFPELAYIIRLATAL